MKTISVLACAIAVAALGQHASADIFTNSNGLGLPPFITFDEFPLGPKTGNEWQPGFGVTFAAAFLETDNLDGFPGIDGANMVGDTGGATASVAFDSPLSAYAMAWITNPGTTTFTAFLGGDVVEQVTLATDFDNPAIAFTVVQNITFDRLEMQIDAAFDSFRIDNLQIPAPGALALLGVAGLIGTRRRRR